MQTVADLGVDYVAMPNNAQMNFAWPTESLLTNRLTLSFLTIPSPRFLAMSSMLSKTNHSLWPATFFVLHGGGLAPRYCLSTCTDVVGIFG